MKSGKAVVKERVEAAGEVSIGKITRDANRNYDEGYIP